MLSAIALMLTGAALYALATSLLKDLQRAESRIQVPDAMQACWDGVCSCHRKGQDAIGTRRL